MPDVDERVPQNLKRTIFLPPVAKGKAQSNARSHKCGVHAAASLICGAHVSCFQSLPYTIYDQDVLSFLWYKDVFCENPELQIYKFTRVVFVVGPVITSANSVPEAFAFYRDLKDIFAKGSFNLRKFLSNDNEVQSLIVEMGDSRKCQSIPIPNTFGSVIDGIEY